MASEPIAIGSLGSFSVESVNDWVWTCVHYGCLMRLRNLERTNPTQVTSGLVSPYSLGQNWVDWRIAIDAKMSMCLRK